MKDRSWIQWLKSWPLLIAAVICFGLGMLLIKNDTQRVYAATAMLTIGCILIGGWIVLLVIHGHSGEDPPPPDVPEDE